MPGQGVVFCCSGGQLYFPLFRGCQFQHQNLVPTVGTLDVQLVLPGLYVLDQSQLRYLTPVYKAWGSGKGIYIFYTLKYVVIVLTPVGEGACSV